MDQDEGIRPGTAAEGLERLRPAFSPDGTITAGNASQISDGAAAVVVTRSGRPPTAGGARLDRGLRDRGRARHQPAPQPSRAIADACRRAGVALPTWTWSRSTRPSPRWRCARPASWSWTRPSSTSTAAPSPSATRSGPAAPGRAHPGHGAAPPALVGAAALCGGGGQETPCWSGSKLDPRRAPGTAAGRRDRRAVARLISWVEDGDRDQLREAAEALNPATGRAQVIRLTGSPGSASRPWPGALVAAYRPRG